MAQNPRGSSGHRRYTAETIGLVESLACLRGTGMPIEEMRRYLELRKNGRAAAPEQKALSAGLEKTLTREMDLIKTRLEYLAGKVAYWEAIEEGNLEKARAIGEANHAITRPLAAKKEIL